MRLKNESLSCQTSDKVYPDLGISIVPNVQRSIDDSLLGLFKNYSAIVATCYPWIVFAEIGPPVENKSNWSIDRLGDSNGLKDLH